MNVPGFTAENLLAGYTATRHPSLASAGQAAASAGSATPPASTFQKTLQKTLSDTDRKQVRKAAGDLVAHALILPILKQLRRGNLAKNTPFAPGTGENTFGPEFDMQIADRIAHSPRMQATDALAQRLLNRGRPAVSATGPATNRSVGVDVHG